MKKNNLIIATILLTLLILPTAFAQDTPQNPNIQQQGQQQANAIASSFKDKSNQALSTEIGIPNWLKWPVKILFGVEQTLTISLLIMLIMWWVILVVLLKNLIEISPLPIKGALAWVASACMTILMGLIGVIKTLSLFLSGVGSNFSILEKLGAGAIFLSIGVLLLIAAIILKIIKHFKERIKDEEASSEAGSIGRVIGMTRQTQKVEKEISDI